MRWFWLKGEVLVVLGRRFRVHSFFSLQVLVVRIGFVVRRIRYFYFWSYCWVFIYLGCFWSIDFRNRELWSRLICIFVASCRFLSWGCCCLLACDWQFVSFQLFSARSFCSGLFCRKVQVFLSLKQRSICSFLWADRWVFIVRWWVGWFCFNSLEVWLRYFCIRTERLQLCCTWCGNRWVSRLGFWAGRLIFRFLWSNCCCFFRLLSTGSSFCGSCWYRLLVWLFGIWVLSSDGLGCRICPRGSFSIVADCRLARVLARADCTCFSSLRFSLVWIWGCRWCDRFRSSCCWSCFSSCKASSLDFCIWTVLHLFRSLSSSRLRFLQVWFSK